MNIVEMNEGTKAEYEVAGTKVTFRDEIMLNLKNYERDFDVEIDICQDDDEILLAGLSKYYVAQIHIPAREYEDAENTQPVPFNMENVTLRLWALEV